MQLNVYECVLCVWSDVWSDVLHDVLTLFFFWWRLPLFVIKYQEILTKKVMAAMMNYKGVMTLLNQTQDLHYSTDLITTILFRHISLLLFLLCFHS